MINPTRTAILAKSVQNYSHWIRLLIGCILLTSAGLKAFLFVTEPKELPFLLHNRWLLIAIVEIEWVMGSFLILGGFPTLVITLCTILFGGFSCVTFYAFLMGYKNCGCFGPIHVRPLYSLLLDVFVVILGILLISNAQESSRPFGLRRYALCALVAAGLLGGYRMFQSGYHQPTQVVLEASDNTIYLEPDTWTSKQLPITRYLGADAIFDGGPWTLLIYRSDCGSCRKAVDYLQKLAQASPNKRFGLIEVPVNSTFSAPISNKNVMHWQLSTQVDWFVATPVMLQVTDGVVESVQTQREVQQLVDP